MSKSGLILHIFVLFKLRNYVDFCWSWTRIIRVGRLQQWPLPRRPKIWSFNVGCVKHRTTGSQNPYNKQIFANSKYIYFGLSTQNVQYLFVCSKKNCQYSNKICRVTRQFLQICIKHSLEQSNKYFFNNFSL